jgi:hypothetical protein
VSLEWKKIDTELPVIIHILSLACQLNKIYSSAASLGLHSRVKMQTISYGGRQLPSFPMVSTKSFVCQFVFVIFADFYQLSIGRKWKPNVVLRPAPFNFSTSSVRIFSIFANDIHLFVTIVFANAFWVIINWLKSFMHCFTLSKSKHLISQDIVVTQLHIVMCQ